MFQRPISYTNFMLSQTIKNCFIFFKKSTSRYSTMHMNKDTLHFWLAHLKAGSCSDLPPERERQTKTQPFVELFTEENTERDWAENVIQPDKSPTFYTMLTVCNRFSEYIFSGNVGFLQPIIYFFGQILFANCTRFMPERTWVMQVQLDELKDGCWKINHSSKSMPEH